MPTSPDLEMVEIATSAGPVAARAREMVERLGRVIPFEAAWLALAEPTGGYTSLVSAGLDERIVEHLNGPATAHIEVAECLFPVGVHEALAVGLFDPRGRHVGFLALLFGSESPPSTLVRRRLHALTPVLAHGIDPLRSLAAAARVVRGAAAGAVLCRGAATRALPGLDDDILLAEGSPVLRVARGHLEDGQVFASFLWPLGGRHAPDGHVRVTVLANSGEPAARVLGAVVLSPVIDARGLTAREMEVLGLLIDGCSNQQIARALVVAPRTVAAHLEHILVKLGAPTRTLAAVRAERDGLYVPWLAGPAGCGRDVLAMEGGRATA